jgi:hypothetical protein
MNSTAWNQYHRRGQVIADVVETAALTGNYSTPWADAPTVWEEYHDVTAFLQDLELRFHTTLMGALDVADEDCEGDIHAAILGAYRSTVQRHHGIRRIIEANAAHPSIRSALATERATLASLAGVDVARLALPTAEMVRIPGKRTHRSLARRVAHVFA